MWKGFLLLYAYAGFSLTSKTNKQIKQQIVELYFVLNGFLIGGILLKILQYCSLFRNNLFRFEKFQNILAYFALNASGRTDASN